MKTADDIDGSDDDNDGIDDDNDGNGNNDDDDAGNLQWFPDGGLEAEDYEDHIPHL
jgi:hypothetical protein